MAIDMFLKMQGPAGIGIVKGEAMDAANTPSHTDELEVLAYSLGYSSTPNAVVTPPTIAPTHPQDLSLTTYFSRASPILLQAMTVGAIFPTVTLTLRKAGPTPVEFLKVVLNGVLISSISQGGSGGEDRLTENISLNFRKITYTYTNPVFTPPTITRAFDFAQP